MIKVSDIFKSLSEYAGDYVSGMNPIVEFNSKLNEVQKDMVASTFPLYDKNERIRTILEPFVKNTTGTTSGTIPKPNGMNRVLGIMATANGEQFPLYYAKENELISQSFIPQRKADFTKRIGYYRVAGTDISIIPSETCEYSMSYLVNPKEASLKYEYLAISSGETSLVETGSVDLEWDSNSFNLILNWMLLKYGVMNRDQFLTEISSYGLNSDLINKE